MYCVRKKTATILASGVIPLYGQTPEKNILDFFYNNFLKKTHLSDVDKEE